MRLQETYVTARSALLLYTSSQNCLFSHRKDRIVFHALVAFGIAHASTKHAKVAVLCKLFKLDGEGLLAVIPHKMG